MSSNIAFPSPVGGVPFPSDFAPSVLFAVLYGLLVPVMAYRVANKKSRTFLLVGSITFSIERIVLFSLRAVQAHSSSRRVSMGLTAYMQSTLGLGFIGVAQDITNLLRCLLVNTTLPMDHPDNPSSSSEAMAATSSGDQPKKRNLYRRLIDVTRLAFLISTIIGIVGNAHYNGVLNNASVSQMVMRLRYASSAVGLIATLFTVAIIVWAMTTIPRVRSGPASLLLLLCALMASPSFLDYLPNCSSAIYRLAVMYNTTTSLTSTSQGSLNTPAEKAEFYVFHMLNEWVALALVLGLNLKEIFNTGMFGDWRAIDETEAERLKRERKEQKKRDKEAQLNNTAV
ncbi:hypothetical protein SERLA73DRAFT_52742 [Serpula lacrymans var. lacrymans S7.3]|uniref:Uncharacterized protein n=2 Tax=Serpula lacrymans var. lacrymans TaxID=341189 RepID=F8PW76_SERL3|nr:hypothetical protein SERLA73DRAFT_52742 [Serpula lacrymans var. lacrymans S7.3]